MKAEPSKHFVSGQKIAAGVAFVPCGVCRAPIDLATSQTHNHVCPRCALTTYVHSWS